MSVEAVKDRNVMDCDALKSSLAIHCSHAGLHRLYETDKFPIDMPDENSHTYDADIRAAGISKLMSDFREQCLDKGQPDKGDLQSDAEKIEAILTAVKSVW